ncbi:hypothetical protein BDZ89DRAFT_1077669 [Hymenopellis radicata]|nr:hypothetical protein BDZ89DRAFT_1077669 [Hymenopellis radicata]
MSQAPSSPPPQASLQRLSEELIALIVDLVDDISSLKSCSLTCRALLPHTRALLFERIVMVLSPLSPHNPQTIERHILPFVRTFVVSPIYVMDFTPMADDDALAGVLEGLVNLETLEIRHCLWEILSPETQSALASTSLHLQCLVLEDMQFPNLDAFLSLITSHSSLRRLSLDVAIDELSEDVARMPALHQLEDADIRNSSRLAPPILNIATILNVEDGTAMVQIIVAAGKNLERLCISHIGHDFDDEFPQNMPLQCTSVERVTLQFAETGDNAWVVRWWENELARNATCCVLQIVINRPFDVGGDLGCLRSWSAFDAHRTVVELVAQ